MKKGEGVMADTKKLTNGELLKRAEKAHKGMRRAFWRWNMAFVVPVIVFSLAAYGLAIYVCTVCWNDINGSVVYHWHTMKWCLLGLMFVNLSCLLGCGHSRFRVLSWAEDLDSQHQIAVENAVKTDEQPAAASPTE